MIVKEFFMTRKDGVKLYRNYSDKNKMILQVETGIKYDEAVDVESAPYTYQETDEDIPSEDEEELEAMEEN